MERPILFKGPLVRAILEGRKTQTRRVVKGAALEWLVEFDPSFVAEPDNGLCPLGQPGDRLWVRETWSAQKNRPLSQGALFYRATDGDTCPGKQMPLNWVERERRWRPSIHMPRWACRLVLEITDVRVQRLQDISPEDVLAEGVSVPVDQDTGHFLLDVSSKFAPSKYLATTDDNVMVQRGRGGGLTTALHNHLLPAHFASLWETINGAGSWDSNPWVWAITFRPAPQEIA